MTAGTSDTARLAAVVASAAPLDRLTRTLRSIGAQSTAPDEIVVCRLDLRPGDVTLIRETITDPKTALIILDAVKAGAAPQRQQAFEASSSDLVLFLDDDVDLDPDCIEGLRRALIGNARLGGVSACIRNQNYRPPGRLYRLLLRALDFPAEGSLSGLCRGPVVHFLPDLTVSEPPLQPMEWLNLTCTMYRRSALPGRLFDGIVGEYALMEDVALSLVVSRAAEIAACRAATIFHDSGDQEYKSNPFRRQMMDVRNRVFIMRHVLDNFGLRRHLQLLLLSAIFSVSVWRTPGGYRDKLRHVFARWVYHLGLYVPSFR